MALAIADAMAGNGQFGGQFRPPGVPLSRLIDFSIQRTYHELQVLADLLVNFSFSLSCYLNYSYHP